MSYTIFCTLPSIYIALFMQQSPSWEANQFAASQETPHILWNPKVHYHNSPPPVPLLSQLDQVHAQPIHVIY